MLSKILICFISSIGITLAAVDEDCLKFKNQYWNGTHCVVCSGCPRGFGVKTTCSSKRNTECQPCWPRYDYSNTTGFEPCILCDTYSNCLDGNAKQIKNCTIFSPPICEGCADGNFFDPGHGIHGGCIKCSPPCTILEDETRPCVTAHNRKCTAKWKEPIIPVSGTPPTVGVTKKISSTSRTAEKGDDQGSDEIGSPELDETPIWEKPWFWTVVVAAVGLGAGSLVLIRFRRRQRNKRRNRRPRNKIRNNGVSCNGDEVQMLLRGLDLPIKNLTIEGKKFIARRLNGKDGLGYFYWQMTAEKLNLFEESKAWEGADNATGKLLTAYGEKEGSSIRNLITALREAELTQFANEIERQFTRDQGARESEITVNTDV